MGYIDDSILVIVDASRVSKRAREKLFMTSRDRTRRGELYTAIERRMEEIIRNDSRLKELRDRRRREALDDRLSDAKPLKEVLDSIIRKSPSLAALFITGKDLSNPFKPKRVGKKKTFIGKERPDYFLPIQEAPKAAFERTSGQSASFSYSIRNRRRGRLF